MIELETREKVEVDAAGVYKYWQLELENAGKAEEGYRKTAEDLIKRYSGEVKLDFNILWANVETLKPVLYSNTARPDVRRRYGSADPIGRTVSLLLERGIAYTCEQYDFDSQIRAVRDESLITGRGVPWVEYKSNVVTLPDGSEAVGEQEVKTTFVSYVDFCMSPATCWDDVRWVARRHMPTRDELVEQFGERGRAVPLGQTLVDISREKVDADVDSLFKRGEVWEIWDKQKRQRVWIATGLREPLSVDDDPYKLERFFPCPKPLYAFTVPNSMIPRAEYEIYRPQVEILNETSKRINALTKQLKVKGIYNAVFKEAQQILKANDGDFIPVTTPDMNTSVQNMIAYFPVDQLAKVIAQLYQAREAQLNTIYQITGLSDIVRGSTAATETATAQQLKGNFAQMRMEPRQRPIQEMIRDIFRIKAEILAEHYDPQTLSMMTQIEVTPEIYSVLRNDKVRGYHIDIETDSTVQPDADADKQRRIEFMTAFADSVAKLAPMVQGGLLDIEAAKSMLSFVTRGFKVGRELEEAIEGMGQGLAQQQQLPPTDPNEVEKLRLQQEGQLKQVELAQNMQLGLHKVAAEKDAKMFTAQVNAEASAQVKEDELVRRVTESVIQQLMGQNAAIY
jgi:hypothetical protein